MLLTSPPILSQLVESVAGPESHNFRLQFIKGVKFKKETKENDKLHALIVASRNKERTAIISSVRIGKARKIQDF